MKIFLLNTIFGGLLLFLLAGCFPCSKVGDISDSIIGDICKSDPEVWSKRGDTYRLSYNGYQEFKDSIHYSKYTNTIDYMNIEYVISKDSINIYYSGGD